jgi:serine/threonine protein kinase/Tol biopolymer transport system component
VVLISWVAHPTRSAQIDHRQRDRQGSIWPDIISDTMGLTPGTCLGPYEIVSPLGAGGMGEVYRARDTRLDRTVAIKILPAHLCSDPTSKQRFEREAKAISSLNHPHVCALHDVGRQDGIDYLVMEYLEGETLAKRLEKGPLPLEQVLTYGTQIADALDKAHRSGITHRDLKPGNIMLTKSCAKLLDFGLAKPSVPPTSSAAITAAVTPPTAVTADGSIVGTFQYMSPEQIEGEELDGRSDIFSLGSVLYEMLTGQRAFPGKSRLSVASAILEKEPASISSLKPMTPPALDHAIRRCLAKDPDDRWQTARDLELELKWIAETGPQPGVLTPAIRQRKLRERLAWTSAVAMAALVLFMYFQHRGPISAPTLRFLVYPPENSSINAAADAALSPDGSHLAFVAADMTGKEILWVRSFDSLTARPLAGTEGAVFPFWSPDSRWVGFFANRSHLKKIDISGGPPVTVASAIAGNGGTWNRNDVIVFATGATRLLYRVSAAGGQVVPITKESETVTATRSRVHFMPDGTHYLYDAPGSGTGRAVYVASLESDSGKLLVESGESPAYQHGRLLYLRGTTLVAQPFDEKRLAIVGSASTLAEQVFSFSASQDGGVLAYWTGIVPNPPQLTWFDRGGKQIGTLGAPVFMLNAHISPDGTKVAAEIYDPQISNTDSDIWLYDTARGVRTRFTAKPGTARRPCWSPDGKHLVFSSNRRGHFDLYEKSADGSGNEELLYESAIQKYCQGWSPDGKSLTLMTINNANRDIWTFPLFGDRKPVPYLQTEFSEQGGEYSPDGKWIAYWSDESGTDEVYLRSARQTGGKLLVSSSGGSRPRWRRDGREIFYLAPTNEVMAAKVRQNGSTLEIDTPARLFKVRTESLFPSYDVSADGQRFLVVSSSLQKQPSPLTVVVHWDNGVKTQ